MLGETRSVIEASYVLNHERNSKVRDQILEVVAALNNEGITPLLIKGASHVMTGLWPDPGARLVGDVDLLVPVEHARAATHVMYELTGNSSAFKCMGDKHYWPVQAPHWEVPVELHFSVFGARYDDVLSVSGLFENGTKQHVGGALFYTPHHEDQLLIAMLHGLAGHRYVYAPRVLLRDLVDVSMIAWRHQGAIDWIRLQLAVEAAGVSGLVPILDKIMLHYTGRTLPWTHLSASQKDAWCARLWWLALRVDVIRTGLERLRERWGQRDTYAAAFWAILQGRSKRYAHSMAPPPCAGQAAAKRMTRSAQ